MERRIPIRRHRLCGTVHDQAPWRPRHGGAKAPRFSPYYVGGADRIDVLLTWRRIGIRLSIWAGYIAKKWAATRVVGPSHRCFLGNCICFDFVLLLLFLAVEFEETVFDFAVAKEQSILVSEEELLHRALVLSAVSGFVEGHFAFLSVKDFVDHHRAVNVNGADEIAFLGATDSAELSVACVAYVDVAQGID